MVDGVWNPHTRIFDGTSQARRSIRDDNVHYYELHEPEYVKRLSKGQQAWDAGDYDTFFMKAFVQRSLASMGPRDSTPLALDLGCGTGALSCYLAERGFEVTGIDIAPTAIDFARRMAVIRGLTIRFDVMDVCRADLPDVPFDFVIDSHLLHCIVFPEQRRRLLTKIHKALKPGGQFWLETMLLPEGQSPDPAWHLDERGVVWHRHNGQVCCAENVERDGAWWTPMRMIVRSASFLLDELASAGFEVIESEVYDPIEPGMPGGIRSRCGR